MTLGKVELKRVYINELFDSLATSKPIRLLDKKFDRCIICNYGRTRQSWVKYFEIGPDGSFNLDVALFQASKAAF